MQCTLALSPAPRSRFSWDDDMDSMFRNSCRVRLLQPPKANPASRDIRAAIQVRPYRHVHVRSLKERKENENKGVGASGLVATASKTTKQLIQTGNIFLAATKYVFSRAPVSLGTSMLEDPSPCFHFICHSPLQDDSASSSVVFHSSSLVP
jgi:hypothetical protein